jgi:hypothetical protein
MSFTTVEAVTSWGSMHVKGVATSRRVKLVPTLSMVSRSNAHAQATNGNSAAWVNSVGYKSITIFGMEFRFFFAFGLVSFEDFRLIIGHLDLVGSDMKWNISFD